MKSNKYYEEIKEWKKTEKFVEMARVGNLPKHTKISVWVNDKGEEREEPHFHIRLSNKSVIRLRFIDLKGMDGKTLEASVMKEFKQWLLKPSKLNSNITNIQASLLFWNSQEFNKRVIKISNLKWIKGETK
jgi:hypothetical protein